MNQTKTQPFNKHLIEKPNQAKIASWYRRNIILDHPNQNIYIQVMWDSYGELNLQEFNYLIQGSWWQFVPLELQGEIRQGIASGYKIKPMVMTGAAVGESHTVIQILDMTDTRHHITDSTINKPLADV